MADADRAGQAERTGQAEHAQPASRDEPWRHEDTVAGRLRLHTVRAGSGPPILLLHGFPEFWFSWRYQIRGLAAEGFSVVAPDLPGYNTSEKPHGIAAYDIDRLVADVAALCDASAGGNAVLVGHDWGGIVAWYAAMRHPERFRRLVIVNAPHPGAYARDFWAARQWVRSLYVFFFQLRGLAEAAIRAGNFRALDRIFSGEVTNPEAFAAGEVRLYKDALAQHGALTSALNYYRAAVRRGRRMGITDVRPIEVPTLLLWGEQDRYLLPSLTEGLEEWVPDLEVHRFPDAGHWLQLDRPDEVTEVIAAFAREG